MPPKPNKFLGMVMMIVYGAAIIVIVAVGYGSYRTWKTGHMPEFVEFMNGSAPTTVDEGLWNGTAEELGDVSWKGKKFLSGGQGINLFGAEKTEKYPFTFSQAASLSDPLKKVIRIDYDRADNPWWLRLIVDEMVSVGEKKFLGLVYIDLIPGFPFRMGYFRLER